MEYRRLGRSGLMVSAVGIGTNELRLVPRKRAIDLLLRSFDLGVNIIHTSPDYEGAEEVVAQAVARTDRKIIVASQGYDVHFNADGRVQHFEHLFEETCRRLKTERLDLYGIAAVDDREAFQENVWGRQGMVEFLLRMKEQGRIGGIFCTNHGDPAHMRKLVQSGVFDALMISCNPLGFHLLTLHPPPGRHFEDVAANCAEIVPLCREHDIGVMAMMPLAGGLLVDSRAFPPRRLNPQRRGGLTARDVLRAILEDRSIACVVPGTGSLDEAEENASAGESPISLDEETRQALRHRVATISGSLCNRCGACEPLCSQQLPVSWLFRAAEMAQQPGEAFETWGEIEYFRLHPELAATCARCENISCACPTGIDIPKALIAAHQHVLSLMSVGLMMPPRVQPAAYRGDGDFRARIVSEEIPDTMARGAATVCRLHVENIGERGWFGEGQWDRGGVLLRAFVDGARHAEARFGQAVHVGDRGHLVFEIMPPTATGTFELELKLLSEIDGYADNGGILLFSRRLCVTEPEIAGMNDPLDSWMRAQSGRRKDDPLDQGTAEQPPEYGVRWVEHNLPSEWRPGDQLYLYLRVENRGARAWHAQDVDGRNVNLVLRLAGTILAMLPLPHDVGAGEEVVISFPLVLPDGTGDWELAFSFVEQNVAWFEHNGVRSLAVRIRRLTGAAEDVADPARAIFSRHNPSHFSPSQGVPRSRSGQAYPSVIAHAAGAIIRDVAGNEWIDYVMGWGAALLGYAHPAITDAVGSALGCGGILALPHRLEAEATQLLVETVPSAELVLFGKNGSDVCTAAVRAARLATGHELVLFSGYHGWQEPFSEAFEPALRRNDVPRALPFALNDLAGLRTLAEQHAGRIAAVMIEPAAQVEGVEGPVRAADRAFLEAAQEIARREGAVLIFDEIMTGFRHPGGSVQAATGVTPDLTCLGKALTSGMPLSALVGRRDVLEPVLSRLFYHPTFKGEVYSFAAAVAALNLYRGVDVPKQVGDYGANLMRSITELGAELGIDGEMVGLPYRMVYRFNESNDLRRAQLRTLLQQSLLQQGVLTFRGFMLPSLAHAASELDRTLTAFRRSFAEVREAMVADRLVSRLEIPLVY